MQHSFLQKIFLTVVAAAVVAGFYVFFYEKIIRAADETMRTAKPAASAQPTPRRN